MLTISGTRQLKQYPMDRVQTQIHQYWATNHQQYLMDLVIDQQLSQALEAEETKVLERVQTIKQQLLDQERDPTSGLDPTQQNLPFEQRVAVEERIRSTAMEIALAPYKQGPETIG